MAVTAGTAYIDLRARLDNLERDLKSIDSKVSRSAKASEDRFTKMSSRMSGAMKAAFAGIGFAGVVRGFSFLTDAAGDLNETMSFSEVTFKGATESVVSWSDSTLESMGLAKQSALEAANSFGGLFQVTGSTAEEAATLSQEMTQLAVDMASAKNVGLDEAVQALGSGLRGEAEPMRRFNVLLSEAAIQEQAVRMGIAKTGQELSEGQKVQARYGLIMEQTTDIQGDYARTSDSAANQTRRAGEAIKQAAAEIGQGLLPMLAKGAEKLAEFAGFMSDVFKASEREADSVQASKDLFEQLADGVQNGSVTMERFNNTVEAQIGSYKDWWNAGGLVDDKIAEDLTKHVDGLRQKIEDGTPVIEGMGNALEDTAEKAAKFPPVFQTTRAAVAKFAGMTGKKLDEWQKGTVGNFNLVEGSLGELADKHKLTADVILRQLRKAFTAQVEFGENWDKVVDRGGDKADDFLKTIQENYGAEAPGIVAALANANDREFNQIVSVWNKAERNASNLSRTVSTEFGDVGRELDDTRRKAIKLGDQWLTLTEALSGPVRASIQHGHLGTGGGFGASMGIAGVGSRLQQGGFRVSGHPAFPPVGQHTAGSYHYSGRALDVNWGPGGESPAEKSRLNAVGYALMASMGSRLKEIFFPAHDPVGGHQDHLHLAMFRGGVIGEPVLGRGLRSGRSYSFGERGPETVLPGVGSGVVVHVHGDVLDGDHLAEKVTRGLRRRSTRVGA